jgi:hypothetical protein
MSRLKIILLVIVVVVLALVGYVFYEDAASRERGYCCMKPGYPCEMRSTGAACLNEGGLLFDVLQPRCTKICATMPLP